MTQPCDPDTGNPGEQLRALQRAKAALLEAGAALTAATSLLAEPLSRCDTSHSLRRSLLSAGQARAVGCLCVSLPLTRFSPASPLQVC